MTDSMTSSWRTVGTTARRRERSTRSLCHCYTDTVTVCPLSSEVVAVNEGGEVVGTTVVVQLTSVALDNAHLL
jgi:hypothetical protein